MGNKTKHHKLTKQEQQVLEKKNFISEAMLQNLPGGYHCCSAEEGYPLTYVTEHFLEILGWTKEELKKQFNNSFFDLLHPEDRHLVSDYIQRISATKNGRKYQEQIYRLRGKSGYRWVTDTTMQMNIDGKIFYQGFISDITPFIEERERRKIELARLERERQQNEVLTALGKNYHTIFQIDLETDTYTKISCREEMRAYYDFHESSAEKLLSNLCNNIVDNKYIAQMHQFFDLSTLSWRLRNREFVETECITKYGNWHRIKMIVKRREKTGKVTCVLYVTQIIDDEKQMEEHLLAQAEHADYANQSKTAFISQVAHDIRTPMNTIFGFLEIAEANIQDPQKVQYSLEKIRTAGEFLKELVNEVLDITRMEDGRMTLQPEILNFSEMLDEFVVSMQNVKPEKKQTFHIDIHNISHEYIFADPLRLKQIYSNIISNAIKYTPDGGVIDFTVYQEEIPNSNCVRILASISDTGIGMSKEFMEKMFTKFERGTDTRINKVHGYGLGLSIVKQMIDLMGGTIDVKSKLGEGSTFTVTLEVPYIEQSTTETNIPQVDYAAQCAGMHILVAEDNELNREVITELLAMYDITCECTENGFLCLQRFQAAAEGTYDAILMDMQMPVMNGIDATKQIRALPLPWAKEIPIIAMTANAMKDDIKNCLSAGMNKHLSKPVDVELLLQTLAQMRCLQDKNICSRIPGNS